MKCARCWTFIILVTMFVVGAATCTPSQAIGPGSTEVKFKDNAGNELGFKIERREAVCGSLGAPAFSEVATTPASVPPSATVAWVDTTTVAGKDYCYRVRAFNNSKLDGTGIVQYSGYTNEAGVAYPLALPAAPSTATVD